MILGGAKDKPFFAETKTKCFWEGLKNGILKAFKITVGYDWPQGFYNYEHSFRAAPLAGYRRGINY